jgi:N6-adenosine-specific RNA methylase IME4
MTPMSETPRHHPLADIFPLMEGAEFEELVADIKRNGLHECVVLLDDQILDGRNRYRACRAAGVEPSWRPFQGDDPAAYVVSMNVARRHLSESQRAMVAGKLATLKQGGNQHSEGLPIGRSSELLNVSERTVARAREVLNRGTQELQSAVERGAVSVAAAADVATESAEAQREIVAPGEREILEAAKRIRGARAEVRRAERVARILTISGGNSPLPQNQKYPVILADPPWHFEVYNEDSGIERAAANHYPTMSLAEICELSIADLAAPDAVVFLWTTAPHLHEAFEVLAAWGFQYVSNLVWVKDKFGLGYWVRNQHELVLIARRGDMPTPAPACRPPSVIQAPTREHSRKPDEVYALIERMYPELPKIELFSRSPREGWAAWGNQSQQATDQLTKPTRHSDENRIRGAAPARQRPSGSRHAVSGM